MVYFLLPFGSFHEDTKKYVLGVGNFNFLLPFGSFPRVHILHKDVVGLNEWTFLLPFGSFHSIEIIANWLKQKTALSTPFWEFPPKRLKLRISISLTYTFLLPFGSFHGYIIVSEPNLRELYELSTPFWEFPHWARGNSVCSWYRADFYSLLGVSRGDAGNHWGHKPLHEVFLLPFGSFPVLI